MNAIAGSLAKIDLIASKKPPLRFKLLTASDLAALPRLRELVRGVLPEQGIGALFGPSMTGKSFLLIDGLACIASGRDWFGHRVIKSVPVLYIGLEGEAGIKQRVEAYEIKHGKLGDGFRFLMTPLDIRDSSDRAELILTIKATGWNGGVICFDTLNRAAPGMDENSSVDMGEVIATLKAIQAELGGLVLVVHHTGKDSNKGMRGHSSLIAALDCAIEVTRSDDRREWSVYKSKDGEDGKAHPFSLEVIEVDQYDDGEPITSCVVRPEENAGETVRRAKVPSGGNQRIVWDALGELFRAAGSFAPQGAPDDLPIGRPCIRLEDAITKVRDRLTVESDRKTERARQAITGLINRGLIAHQDGFVWCK